MSQTCNKPSLTEPTHGRMKRIRVYLVDDPETCNVMNINPKKCKTFTEILKHITETLKPVFGPILRLYELNTDKYVISFDELQLNETYVAMGAYGTVDKSNGRYTMSSKKDNFKPRKGTTLYLGETDPKMMKFLEDTAKAGLTVFYALINGISLQVPQKIVLRKQDLNWEIIIRFLDTMLDIPEGVEHLATIYGEILVEPREIQHGFVYVAIQPKKAFMELDYLDMFKYLCSNYRGNYVLSMEPAPLEPEEAVRRKMLIDHRAGNISKSPKLKSEQDIKVGRKLNSKIQNLTPQQKPSNIKSKTSSVFVNATSLGSATGDRRTKSPAKRDASQNRLASEKRSVGDVRKSAALVTSRSSHAIKEKSHKSLMDSMKPGGRADSRVSIDATPRIQPIGTEKEVDEILGSIAKHPQAFEKANSLNRLKPDQSRTTVTTKNPLVADDLASCLKCLCGSKDKRVKDAKKKPNPNDDNDDDDILLQTNARSSSSDGKLQGCDLDNTASSKSKSKSLPSLEEKKNEENKEPKEKQTCKSVGVTKTGSCASITITVCLKTCEQKWSSKSSELGICQYQNSLAMKSSEDEQKPPCICFEEPDMNLATCFRHPCESDSDDQNENIADDADPDCCTCDLPNALQFEPKKPLVYCYKLNGDNRHSDTPIRRKGKGQSQTNGESPNSKSNKNQTAAKTSNQSSYCCCEGSKTLSDDCTCRKASNQKWDVVQSQCYCGDKPADKSTRQQQLPSCVCKAKPAAKTRCQPVSLEATIERVCCHLKPKENVECKEKREELVACEKCPETEEPEETEEDEDEPETDEDESEADENEPEADEDEPESDEPVTEEEKPKPDTRNRIYNTDPMPVMTTSRVYVKTDPKSCCSCCKRLSYGCSVRYFKSGW